MNLIEKLKNRRVLIVGDVMIDRYVHGSVTRISPEAPVPVLNFLKQEDRLGGAGNVALNECTARIEPFDKGARVGVQTITDIVSVNRAGGRFTLTSSRVEI